MPVTFDFDLFNFSYICTHCDVVKNYSYFHIVYKNKIKKNSPSCFFFFYCYMEVRVYFDNVYVY